MPTTVRCPSCLREEAWEGDERVAVRVPGGSRRPEGPASVAAWQTIDSVLDARDRTLAGACEACGQPLVAEAARERIPYTVHLPGGDLRVDRDGVVGPGGVLTTDEARRWVAEQAPEPPGNDAGTLAFTALGAVMVGVGVLLWMASMAFVVWFIVQGVQTGQLFTR